MPCSEPDFDYLTALQSIPVVLGMTEATPQAVLERLLDELVASGRLAPSLRDEAVLAVNAREESGGSTALANGIAIPHGYLDVLPGIVAAMGIHAQGVDCNSIDGQPSRIFIVLLNRRGARNHIRFLAAVNRRLIVPEIRTALLIAQTKDEVLRLLAK